MLIAQITDLHVRQPGQKAYRVVETDRYLPPTVAALNALDPRPEVVLITGDATDFGRPEEYATLAERLAPLEIPWYLIAGNHDDRQAMRAAFPEHDYLGEGPFIQYAIERFPLRLLALDTLIPGEGRGELCAQRLDWLAARLAEQPERPTLIFMHHPPFATGIAHMDAIGLTGAAEMAAIVRDYPNVERIICGHVHRTIFQRFAGTIASCCPSTAHQVALDLRDNGPSAFVMEPPGYQLHLWRDGELITHHAVFGDYGMPHPFHEEGGLIDE
ncbi:phosphodiesterase [Salinicola sp. MH3R3-1]|uniref:phosphodiesterase n=1 Tax=Salinicola sp. MH3R3-1 TaxID=1928762 RepID=UPI00094E7F62|nr:phosphodiesterase [Salinicola sp. MH3R3-1]OLO08385.1 phosphodiesterase [Salinicola sp. MH3R3-1]